MKLLKYAAAFGVALLPMAAVAYSPVTDARLTNPEPENWLQIRGNYQGWMYSPLDQINTTNVKHLTPVWAYATGVTSGHEAPPIVNNGMMFVVTPYNQILALNAATGNLIWKYKRELPEGFSALHNTTRGIALYGDKLYLAGQDAVLVALDAATGKVAWESPVEDWHTGYYMTMAPLVVNGKVMVGCSGGEYGIRGFVQAFDANSGKSVWKTYTVPGPGEAGHDTWQGDTWKRGGASIWMTGTYDPEDQGSPTGAPATARPGSAISAPVTTSTPRRRSRSIPRPARSRATSSTTGTTPGTGTRWTRRCSSTSRRTARTSAVSSMPARNGYLYWLERSDSGAIKFMDAKALREADGLQEHRSDHRPADLQRGPQARHRQVRRLLPVAVGRQGLAVRGLQPEDRHDLHSGQRQPLRPSGRQEGRVRGRPVVDRRVDPRHRLHGRQERALVR